MTPPPRIIDVIFDRRPSRPWPLWFGLLTAALLHGLLFSLAISREPSLENWSARLSIDVHKELSRMRPVEFPTAPPPKPRTAPPQPSPQPEADTTPPRPNRAPSKKEKREPAAAGRALTAPASATVDLTQQTFVVGQTATFVGGVTAPGATGTTAVHDGEGAPVPRVPSEPDRSRPVRLAQAQWRCPWPTAADDARIDAQTATITVLVAADGTVLDTRVVRDPGYGFGAAAQRCAQQTRFSPARDQQGQAMRAWSPAIRVHFSR